jgi:putative transposase
MSRTVQMLGRRYVSYFNYLYKRSGTLWEGRFKSSPIESDRYLFACYRYIELNPVRAQMVQLPAHHVWSSYQANATGRADDLVTAHSMFLALSQDENPSTVEAIRQALQKGIALGSKDFCRELEDLAGKRASPAPRGRPRKGDDKPGVGSQPELI